MNQKLKRYGFRIGKPERGNVETIIPVEDHIGAYVKLSDIEPLIESMKSLFKRSKETAAWVENHMFENDEGDGDFYVKAIEPFNELETMRVIASQALKSIGEV